MNLKKNERADDIIMYHFTSKELWDQSIFKERLIPYLIEKSGITEVMDKLRLKGLVFIYGLMLMNL